MRKDITSYLEEEVIPLIAEKFPDVAADMTVQVLGSYGIGREDEHSDLEVAFFLADEVWKAEGGHVQLLLDRLPPYAPKQPHADWVVWRLSQQRHINRFVPPDSDIPWDEIAQPDEIVKIYEARECVVVRDPHKVFSRIREATEPERVPGWLWKKLMVVMLKRLAAWSEELRTAAKRHNGEEAMLVLGKALQTVLRLAFVVNRRYYPWLKHLRRTFDGLPEPAPQVSPLVDAVLVGRDWQERADGLEAMGKTYIDHIQGNGLLPEINLRAKPLMDELVWAERCSAWHDPNWRDLITRAKAMAQQAGYDPKHFWIWTYWGWSKKEGQPPAALGRGTQRR